MTPQISGKHRDYKLVPCIHQPTENSIGICIELQLKIELNWIKIDTNAYAPNPMQYGYWIITL